MSDAPNELSPEQLKQLAVKIQAAADEALSDAGITGYHLQNVSFEPGDAIQIGVSCKLEGLHLVCTVEGGL